MPSNKDLDRHLKKSKSGVYHAEFKDASGTQHSRSTKSRNLKEARAVLDQSRLIELEIAARAKSLNAESLTAIMSGRKVTCASSLAEWVEWRKLSSSPNTLRTQRIIIESFFSKLGAEKWPVTKLTLEHIDQFVNDPADTTKRSNRDLRLASLRSFFEFISARAYCVGNPSRLVKVRLNKLSVEQKEHIKREPMSEKEFRHIVAHTEGFYQIATELSYWAGLRLSDCANFEWSSILPDELVVWTQKSGSDSGRVAIPIDDPLFGGGALRMTFMRMFELNRHAQYVFPAERETNLDPEKRAKLSVYYSRILKDLGIEGKSFHCLRHAFAQRLADAGVEVEKIGRAMGHAVGREQTNAVTKGYIK